jgi:hypothetical protein
LKVAEKSKRSEKSRTQLVETDSNIGLEFSEASSDEDEDEMLPYGSVSTDLEKLKQKLENRKNFVNLPGASVVLETKKDTLSPHLQYFCLSNPISVVRGLGHVLRLDLSLFSTKTLVETDPDHVVEVRNQKQQPTDENWDENGKSRVWKCKSFQSYTTLSKYAHYQANSFQV